MKGAEFVRRVRKVAKNKGVSVELVESHGKGSHAMLYLGGARTTIKDRKKEIAEGLLGAMCSQLGITKSDLMGA